VPCERRISYGSLDVAHRSGCLRQTPIPAHVLLGNKHGAHCSSSQLVIYDWRFAKTPRTLVICLAVLNLTPTSAHVIISRAHLPLRVLPLRSEVHPRCR